MNTYITQNIAFFKSNRDLEAHTHVTLNLFKQMIKEVKLLQQNQHDEEDFTENMKWLDSILTQKIFELGEMVLVEVKNNNPFLRIN